MQTNDSKNVFREREILHTKELGKGSLLQDRQQLTWQSVPLIEMNVLLQDLICPF